MSDVIDLSRDVNYRDIWKISLGKAKAVINPQAFKTLKERRDEFLKLIERGGRCYGVTTGVGGMKDVEIDPGEMARKSRDFLREHAAGLGNPLERTVVRGAMAILARQLLNGYSGVSPDVVSLLVEMLNRDIVPIVPRYGSLGASGDLAPMAYIGLAMTGEGFVEKGGRVIRASQALGESNLKPVELGPKEALSIINNTAMSASIAVHALVSAERLLKALEISSSMAMEAMGTPGQHIDLDLLSLKRHPGILEVARDIHKILNGSRNLGRSGTIQDIYSYRCAPHVLGAFKDAMEYVRSVIDREINAVTDNPVLIRGMCVSGCNFHGIHIAISMDLLSISIIPPLIQCERRIAAILDRNMSRGLPPFLSEDPGRSSGLMMLQYLAASLLNRIKILSSPATQDNTPTSANHEDHVSNSLNAGLKALEIAELGFKIASIEVLIMSRALSLRGWADSSSPIARKILRIAMEILSKTETLGDAVEIMSREMAKLIDTDSIVDH
jgi:histidine ammonia-lyase